MHSTVVLYIKNFAISCISIEQYINQHFVSPTYKSVNKKCEKTVRIFSLRVHTNRTAIKKTIMHTERQIQTQKEIVKYIRGDLSDKEVDKLWVKFLKDPEWYYYFEIELYMVAIFKE